MTARGNEYPENRMFGEAFPKILLGSFRETAAKAESLQMVFQDGVRAYPFSIEWRFLLKRVDKSPADVTERSNKIRKNPDVHTRASR